MDHFKVDFDLYASDYEKILNDSTFFGECAYYCVQKSKVSARETPKAPSKLLEYGCGTGRNLKPLQEVFPLSLCYGCDVSAESLKFAAQYNSNVNFFKIGDPLQSQLSGQFDLIFIANMFHHITDDAGRRQTLQNLQSLLAPHGRCIVFEHNPFNPATQWVVHRCEFDKDAHLLTPSTLVHLFESHGCFKKVKSRFTLFFPPFLKRFFPLEKYLSFFPLGAQYYCVFEKL